MDSMRTLAPDGAPVMHAPSLSLGASLGDLTAFAMAKGERERLHCVDGSWMCWGCGAEYAPFHVSLHCEWCLQQARERRVQRLLAEARRAPEDRRWEGMAQLIAKTLDREGAVKLLEKARQLDSKTPERMDALNLTFDRRFQSAAPGAHWGTYARHAASDPAEEWTRG